MDPKLAPAPGRIGFEQSPVTKTAGLRFIRRSPGLIEDWHPAPQRQYGITLSGRGEVEVAGGKKIRLEPGRIILIEDLTGKGHITRAVGPEAWTSVLIPLADH
jgi:quercetin dioxygenase-like cupin family protein